MEVLAALEGSAPAQWVRSARWGYAAVNGAHIVGIAMLIGAILPLNLRLMGFRQGVARGDVVRLLAPFAAAGLTLAVATGVLMFASRATEYAALGFWQAKMVLVLIGAGAAILLHAAHGWALETAPRGRLMVHAGVSLVCWTGALALGRLIAFAE